MADQCSYGYTRELAGLDFDSALERVTGALKEQGFDLLLDIDHRMIGPAFQPFQPAQQMEIENRAELTPQGPGQ